MTSFIIVMEMVDGHGLVLSLMAGALLSSGVSRLVSTPLYAALAELQVRRAVPAPDDETSPAPAATDASSAGGPSAKNDGAVVNATAEPATPASVNPAADEPAKPV
jgi:hypothetical protein